MLLRSVMIGLGSMALGCSSNLDLGTEDAAPAVHDDAHGSDAGHDAHGSGFTTDGGSVMTLVYTYCSYTSDAGAPACSAYAPWSANAAEVAQAELNCMTAHGSMVGVCPSTRLVGCCSTPLCKPPPPGESEACAFTENEQPGMNVVCSYDEDAATTHVQDLECVASGGAWTTTVPQ
jgi:hypothetical protein